MKIETLKKQRHLKNKHKPKGGKGVTDVGKKRSFCPGVGGSSVRVLRSPWKGVKRCSFVLGWL